MLDQRQIFVPDNPVPRTSILASSVFTHVVALALILLFRHSAGPHLVPEKYITAQTVSGSPHVTFNSNSPPPARAQANRFHMPRRTKQARAPQPVNPADSPGLQILREHAKEATKGLMMNFKLRHIYGFSPGPEYQLAVQTSGAIPIIPASDLPPRFEQYLIVEVTIDIDGRVADARLVTGMATPKIEHTLLSAIRDFKYIPAKRDGSPIPCQVDIVIHIPS
ncbi:MAG TPA: energy transducer TonB [Candidatus Angelobacter sp.]